MKRSLRRRQRIFFLLLVLAVALRSSTAASVSRGDGDEEEEEEEVAEDVSAERTTAGTTTTTPSTTTPAAEEPPAQPVTNAIPENQRTAAPTVQEATTSPSTPTREAPLYRFRGPKDETCILLEVDGILNFKYNTTMKEEKEAEANTFIPEEVTVGGTCYDDSAILTMEWSTYKLSWNFFKTPGGEKWYVDKIELSFNTSERIFEHTRIPGRKLTLSTPKSHHVLMFPTPVGWSFTCKKETPVELRDHSDFSVTLLLREFHLQPFIFKGDDFGPEHECSARGVGALIDETAPIAVGSTLAIVVLLTVTGYGVYRYFKVKKVQYDTME